MKKGKSGTARTGQAVIARRARRERRGVQVALDKLTTQGLVTVVRRGRLNGDRHYTGYIRPA